jgi:hypothetical protein
VSSASETGIDIDVDSSDNVYMMGWVSGQGAGSDDLLLVKINNAGNLVWSRALGSGGFEGSQGGVAVDSNNDVFVATTFSGSNQDMVIAKFSSAGSLQWQKSIATGNNDGPEKIVVSPDGAIVIAGYTNAARSCVAIKLPSLGTTIGTYGAYTYATSTLTVTTSLTITASAATFTFNTSALSVTSGTLSVATPSLSIVKTLVTS